MKQILYVDDEMINLKLFEANFKRKLSVFTAGDGYSGLKVIDENPCIQIVISDMKMPNMNGMQFIKKSKEKYPNKKYFILTSFDLTSEIQDALNSGLIAKYFRKPFNIKEINLAINAALADLDSQ
jgi:two-component system response regulator (stage 0 sporulation protein F)